MPTDDIWDSDDSIGLEDAPRVPRVEDLFNKSGPKIRTAEELARDFPNQRRDLTCPDCGDRLVLKDGKYGIFYGCVKWDETQCKGAHNCHKGTAEPLGIPGNQEVRHLRKQAHEAFDRLWKDQNLRSMTRDQAYRWMQTNLRLSEKDAHIASLDKAGCEKLIRAVDRFYNPPTRFDRDDPL